MILVGGSADGQFLELKVEFTFADGAQNSYSLTRNFGANAVTRQHCNLECHDHFPFYSTFGLTPELALRGWFAGSGAAMFEELRRTVPRFVPGCGAAA